MKNNLLENLQDNREYIVTFEGGETKFLFFYQNKLYEDGEEYPYPDIDSVTDIQKSPNFDKKIRISGTYGDPVTLYLDGYVSTKYGDFLKIKSVDIEKGDVYCHSDSFDFSRISSSYSNNKNIKKEYLEHGNSIIHRKGIRKGSKLLIGNGICELEVDYIIEPNCIDEFDFKICLTNKELITFNKKEANNIKVLYTPYTKEEEVEQIIFNNTNFSKIKDTGALVKELIEYFEK